MRILLAHNNYTIQGGAEVFFHEIARVLEKNGHEVEMFTCAEEGLHARYSEHFPKVAHFSEGNLLAKSFRVPSIVYNRASRAGMTKVLQDFRPDILHCFAIYGRMTPSILDAAREAGVPTVMSCNDYKHICPNYKLFHHGSLCEDCKGGKFYSAIKNRCCHDSLAVSTVSALEAYAHNRTNIWRKNVDRFLFASRFMEGKTREFWGEGRFLTDILQNPFDASDHYIEPNVGTTILYFGRLIEEKGVNVLLDAARQCQHVQVVIAGDGPDRLQVEAAASELPNVCFAGPAWGDDLKQHLSRARAVVVPSLWHENFPYVILQAFAAGKPVIGSRRGGIPELVEAGPHGWLFEPTRPMELAAVIQRVAQLSDEEVKSMGSYAQRYVTVTFSDDAIYAELKRIYGEVANS
jgi:glycosyltransferase involved in cell wall biosynthesis